MGRVKCLSLLLASLLCLAILPTPALAGGGPEAGEPLNVLTSWAESVGPGMDPEKDVMPGTKDDAAETTEKPDKEEQKPLTPEGNMTLVDDSTSDSKERQFLTVTSRKGNYFYLIIDRANDGTDNVHFLNQVDEADLLPLIETSEEEAAPAACSCTKKCFIGAVNTSCELCAADMSVCVGKEPEPEPESEPDGESQPEKKGGVNVASIVSLVVLAGGGAVYFLKFRKKKPDVKGQDDLDDYDYGDEEESDDEDDLENDGDEAE